jgi:hypothetical protein
MMSCRLVLQIAVVLSCPVLRADETSRTRPLAHANLVGSMIWPRVAHAATLLSDGRVLITGGSAYSNESPIPWAEIFDPATGTFRTAGAMAVPRHGHVAVALHDGRVLVAGGWRAGYVIATDTAEVWDPAADRFVPAGSMTTVRGNGAATAILADGRVLLIGGVVEGEFGMATDAIDVFDPGTLRFERWGTLVMARSDPGVLQLDASRLIVFGGSFRCCDHPGNARRNASQEIIDLERRVSTLDGDALFPLSSGAKAQSSPCAPPEQGALVPPGQAFWVSSKWHDVSIEGGFQLDGVRGLMLTETILAVVRKGRLVAVDLPTGRLEPLDDHGWGIEPCFTPLRCGSALVTGGALDHPLQIPVASAWVVSVE